MAINDNILQQSWEGKTKGTIEEGLKDLLQGILWALAEGIADGSIGMQQLATSLQLLINGKYAKPGTGIPADDLSQSVRNSLAAADSALQRDDLTSLQNAVTNLQTALNALTQNSDSQNIINTFNEIVTYLEGIKTNDPKLANTIVGLQQSITALQNAVEGKQGALTFDSSPTENSTNPVTSGGVYAALQSSVGDVPTKVSDLENDEAFVTAEEVAGVVAAEGDIAIIESTNYIDIIISHPELDVTTLAPMSASTKSGTFKVSGTHLKGDVTISTSATNWTLSKDGGTTTSQSLTLSPTDGTLEETTITVIYSGTADSTGNTIMVASTGATSQTVTASYTVYAGPTIIPASSSAIALKTGAGSTDTATLGVTGVNLTAGITATVSGTGFSVCATENGTYGSNASLPSSGGTLYIKWSPTGSSGVTGSLTLSSDGATDVAITLNGAVSAITTSVDSLSLSTDQGVSTTGTFTVEGSNLREDIAISASGDYFSVSPATIQHSSGSVSSTTVTVTYNPSASGSHSGTITIQSSGVTKTISLSGTAAAATTSDAEGKFTKEINGKTIYFKRLKVNDEFTNNVGVYNADYNTSAAASTKYSGAISIPATVACDGTTYNVTTIAGYAFGSCTGLTSLTIAEGITTISVNAIRGCTNNSFTSITIPNSVTSLADNNLYDCTKLTNIVIGDGVTAIGKYFAPGGTISNITIGSNVASFGQYSEFKMSDSGIVTIKRTTPPSVNGVVFKTSGGSYPCNATLKVPSEAVNTFKTAGLWGVDGSGAANWHQFNPDNIEAITE